VSWSPQQDAAIRKVSAWVKNKSSPQVFRLFGFAGTGKTTLAKQLASDVKGQVLYACFTGKAALVLRKKGCDGASTIHSLIYRAEQDPDTGEVAFRLNLDSDLAGCALLVVDEVSMVNEELARDLMSFGIKILVLGDPFQLRPVKGEGYFINAEPDVMLTEVHRQAADNPIIRMSMDIREGRGLSVGDYGDSWVLSRRELDKARMREIILDADQVLCGVNKTRHAFNRRIRELRGRVGSPMPWHPVTGDKLVCLQNNKTLGLLNGGLWSVDDAVMKSKSAKMRVSSLDGQPGPVDVEVLLPFFCGQEDTLDWREKRDFQEFTYGDTLTVHKAQGSQWDNVVLFDESGSFREDRAKHQYTGVTRAAERIGVVVP
jgi:exodeoxyribonuclease-5